MLETYASLIYLVSLLNITSRSPTTRWSRILLMIILWLSLFESKIFIIKIR